MWSTHGGRCATCSAFLIIEGKKNRTKEREDEWCILLHYIIDDKDNIIAELWEGMIIKESPREAVMVLQSGQNITQQFYFKPNHPRIVDRDSFKGLISLNKYFSIALARDWTLN